MIIRLPGRFPLLRRGPSYDDDRDQRLTIDLSELEFASPLELAAVASLATATATNGSVRVIVPGRVDVASYLQRMNLFAVLGETVEIVGPLPSEIRQSLPQSLLEVRSIADGEEGSAVGEWFCRALAARLGAARTRAPFKMFGELLENAWIHGVSPNGAFAAAQLYSGATTRRPGLEFAICDNGVGVLDHLRRNPRYASVASSPEALDLAFQRGVSGTADARGMGLAEVLRLATQTQGASLVFASDDAAVHHRATTGGLTSTRSRLPGRVAGTWVWLRVHLPALDS